jgi:transposase
VSERTFYNWKPRFEAGGYEALERFQSQAPKNPRRTPREVEDQVIKMRRENEEWGKRRIADELAKGNNWVRVVSPNTVRRILRDADLWPEPEETEKKGDYKRLSEQQRNRDKR